MQGQFHEVSFLMKSDRFDQFQTQQCHFITQNTEFFCYTKMLRFCLLIFLKGSPCIYFCFRLGLRGKKIIDHKNHQFTVRNFLKEKSEKMDKAVKL